MSEDTKMPAGLDYQGRHETRADPRDDLDREVGSFFRGILSAMAITAAAVAIAMLIVALVGNPAHAARRDCCGPSNGVQK